MINNAYISTFYQTPAVKLARLLLFCIFSFWLYSTISENVSISLPLFFLSALIQIEIFFRFKIFKTLPILNITNNDGKSWYSSCTIAVMEEIIKHQKTGRIIKAYLNSQSASFLVERIPLSISEIPFEDIDFKEVLNGAARISKATNGTYITTLDLVASYISIIEPRNKLLFNKQTKLEEFMGIVHWARQKYPQEEKPSKRRVEYFGRGIGEALVTGWTPETKKYTRDYSYIAYQKRPQILGREKEYALLLDTISRNENNNVLLVGNPGSGRENLISLFALESILHSSSARFPHLKILELMIGPLIAGAANRAELEGRLQSLVEEVSHSGNIVLYIPEFQNIAGSSAYDIDLTGALYPYLKSGKLPIIASVTTGSFKSYIEKSPAKEAFAVIQLLEPDKETAIKMILKKVEDIENKNSVILTYKALTAAVEYADRYFQDASLPGSAADLLENVSHSIAAKKGGDRIRSKSKKPFIFDTDIISTIEEKTRISIAAPKAQERDLLLHLEERMHQRVVDQEQAITAIAEAMRRLRAGLTTLKRPISFLFLGPTGVGKTETAKALAELYYGGEEMMIRLDMSEYADEEGVKRLLGATPGEGEERGELTDKITDRPASLILLDEFEKAHPKILDLFLQVLEDGRLTDNKGKTANFVNSIIIATSNAGAEFVREEIKKGSSVDKNFSKRLLDELQTQHLFRPELLNRFDDVVIFKPLGFPEMEQITRILLTDLTGRLLEQDIEFTYDDKLLQKIIHDGFDVQFGARPLRRFIQSNIEDIIAQKKLKEEIKRGSKVYMSIDMDSIVTKIT